MKSFILAGAMCLATTLPGTADAARYTVVKGSEVSFVAQITGSSFEAKTQTVSGKLDYDPATKVISKASIAADASSFKTGMGMRDKHMKNKYLKCEDHPVIQLKLENITIDSAAGAETEIEGTFIVLGKSKKVKMKTKISKSDANGITSESHFKIDITDFGIKQPKFAVVKMDTVVDVTVKLILKADK